MKTFQQIDLCWVSDDKNPLAASPRKMFQSNSAEHHHNGNLGPIQYQISLIHQPFIFAMHRKQQTTKNEKFSTNRTFADAGVLHLGWYRDTCGRHVAAPEPAAGGGGGGRGEVRLHQPDPGRSHHLLRLLELPHLRARRAGQAVRGRGRALLFGNNNISLKIFSR